MLNVYSYHEGQSYLWNVFLPLSLKRMSFFLLFFFLMKFVTIVTEDVEKDTNIKIYSEKIIKNCQTHKGNTKLFKDAFVFFQTDVTATLNFL